MHAIQLNLYFLRTQKSGVLTLEPHRENVPGDKVLEYTTGWKVIIRMGLNSYTGAVFGRNGTQNPKISKGDQVKTPGYGGHHHTRKSSLRTQLSSLPNGEEKTRKLCASEAITPVAFCSSGPS